MAKENPTSDEGTVSFWLRPERPGGLTDASVVRFPPVSHGSLRVTAVKNPDGKITITTDGLHGRTFTFSEPIPPCDERGLFVVVTWTTAKVELYFNGKAVNHINVPLH